MFDKKKNNESYKREININEELLETDINDTMVKIEGLYHIMDSCAKLSYLYGSWYTTVFKMATIINGVNPNEESIRRDLLTLYNTHTRVMNESISANTGNAYDFIFRNDKMNIEFAGSNHPIVLTAMDLAKAINEFNHDIGDMLKDSNISKWKGRYFGIIEKDMIKIINELESYRLDMSRVYLTDFLGLIEKQNIKINSTQAICDAFLYILRELDAFYKECSVVINKLAMNNHLTQPIIVDNDAIDEEIRRDHDEVNPLPDDF